MTGMQFFFFSFFGGWGRGGCNSAVVEKRVDQKRKCKLRTFFFLRAELYKRKHLTHIRLQTLRSARLRGAWRPEITTEPSSCHSLHSKRGSEQRSSGETLLKAHWQPASLKIWVKANKQIKLLAAIMFSI